MAATDDHPIGCWQPTGGRMVRYIRLGPEPLDIRWLPDGAKIVAAAPMVALAGSTRIP